MNSKFWRKNAIHYWAIGPTKSQPKTATMKVAENRRSICGWPTDVLSIDHCVRTSGFSKPHTLIAFIPGNPGVIHWYVDFLFKILENLGDGFAVRGVSYAGHGVGDDVVGTDGDHSTCIAGSHNTNVKGSQEREKCMRKDMNILDNGRTR